MFGAWYISFGILAITIPLLVLFIVAKCKSETEWNKRRRISEWEDAVVPLEFSLAVSIFILVISVAIAICTPIGAKKEIVEFEYKKEYVEEAVENGNELENISITQTIIESNDWLTKAKADLDIFGCFSKYYNSGLENIEPIAVKNKKINTGLEEFNDGKATN